MFRPSKKNEFANWKTEVENGITFLYEYTGNSNCITIPSGENVALSLHANLGNPVYIDFNNVPFLESSSESSNGEVSFMANVKECKNLPTNINYDYFFKRSALESTCEHADIDYPDNYNFYQTYAYSAVKNIRKFPRKIKKLSETFSNCACLIEICDDVLPADIQILNRTFYKCTSLRKGADLSRYRKIRALLHTYDSCTCLTETGTFNDEITNMEGAFSNCVNLIVISPLPRKVKILNKAFFNCRYVTTLPELPHTIHFMVQTFRNCASLKIAPKIPYGVLITEGAFMGCIALRYGADIPDSVVSASSMYEDCAWLGRGVRIGASVLSTARLYRDCISMTYAPDVPDNVECCEEMFSGCRAMRNTPQLGAGVVNARAMYKGCISMIQYPREIPKSAKMIDEMFLNCVNATGNIIIRSEQIERAENFLDGARTDGTVIYIPFRTKRGKKTTTYKTFKKLNYFDKYNIQDLNTAVDIDNK